MVLIMRFAAAALLVALPRLVSAASDLDERLQALAAQRQLTGNPAQGRTPVAIESSPLAQLGRALFFSKSLSVNFDVACASCHHPLLAGADGLSLPVGVGAIEDDRIGPGRRHDGNTLIDPEADGGPNVERNTPSTFNSAFYDFSLFYDGRVEAITWQDGAYLPWREWSARTGSKAAPDKLMIKTPDSIFQGPDVQAGTSLLQAQARFPLVAATEMRGLSRHFGGNSAVRAFLVQRLSGEVPGLAPADSAAWQARFRQAFADSEDGASELISFARITEALAQYQRSQVFIDTPWKAYLEKKGDIPTAAKRGALLFYSDISAGGAACFRCHGGDFFTNEDFYNMALPQFGRGNFVYGQDLGRYSVSRRSQDMFAFRVPSLLNVAATAPYGHTGAFNDLQGIIRHHLDPQKSIASYDFTLQQLPQFRDLAVTYPRAQDNTRATLQQHQASGALPMPVLKDDQIADIVAFLQTLTDPCVSNRECLGPWLAPSSLSDPHRLQAIIEPNHEPNEDSRTLLPQPQPVAKTAANETGLPRVSLGSVPRYQPRCTITPTAKAAAEGRGFVNVTGISGITIDRQFDFASLKPSLVGDGLVVMEHLLFSGGVASGDINGDCLMDLVINQGNAAGAQVYLNQGDGTFVLAEDNWGLDRAEDITGPMLVDLNGDRWPDLFHGNIYGSAPGIWLNNGRRFVRQTRTGFRVSHVTLGGGFGDVDGDGDLDAFLAHWSRPGKAEEEHLWLNNGQGQFQPGARQFRLTGQFGERDFTFTPNFPDLNNDGRADLLSTADFMTSQVFINKDHRYFINSTDKQVITDQNGMGAAIADFDNDGDLDWFVSSIYVPPKKGVSERDNFANGNRLYRNDGIKDERVIFADITDQAGVRQGGWGWGACAADFNNDGWVDIFHTNGLPFEPGLVRRDLHYLFALLGIQGFADVQPYETFADFARSVTVSLSDKQKDDLEALYYVGKKLDTFYRRGQSMEGKARLFINQGGARFQESSRLLGIADPGQGRGISCLDYDRDGDIDVLIINNQGAVSLYRNDFGNRQNFLTVRLRGAASNSAGIGARIVLQSPLGQQMRQVRVENNYISQNPSESHFGLAQDREISQLTVHWPGGKKQRLTGVQVNQVLVIEEPDGALPPEAEGKK